MAKADAAEVGGMAILAFAGAVQGRADAGAGGFGVTGFAAIIVNFQGADEG